MKVEPTTKIWLQPLGEKTFNLPVNPKEIEVKGATDPDEFDIVGKGQVAVPQYPDLRTFKWKSFFPGDTDAPYARDTAFDISEYVQILETVMANASLIKLTIYRESGYNTSTWCMIKNFTTTDVGGEPHDLNYSIELEEYKPYEAEKVVVKTSKKTKKKKATTKKKRKTTTKKLRVGAKVVANGKYWYTSLGDKPSGTAKNLKTEIKRIVTGRKYPYLIGNYGWTDKSSLQVK